MKVDVQLSPAVEPWPDLRDGDRSGAEEAGFGAAWVFDHFAGAMIGGTTMLECFTTARCEWQPYDASASASDRSASTWPTGIRVCSPMLCRIGAAHLRRQVHLGPRGGHVTDPSRWGAEHADLDIPLGATLADRHARFAAVLDELDRLWGEPASDLAATYPRPVPRPPIIVVVNERVTGTDRGERCDGINVRRWRIPLSIC